MRALLYLALLWQSPDPAATARARMVREQIEDRGVRHAGVLRAMREIPRHLFVPAGVRALAYEDRPLPIGFGATISQPYVVAWMSELLEPAATHRVLEIGTGSGYQAAVLAAMVERVYTIEIVPELADSARALLKKLGYRNVEARQADGYRGWPEAAPFDRIILTAAPPEVPRALIDQLARGGRLVAPEGASPFTQELVVIDKRPDGSTHRRSVGGVAFVPMVPK